MKRIISITLSLTLLASSVSVFANEANNKDNDTSYLEYQYEKNDLVIESNTKIGSDQINLIYDLANKNSINHTISNATPFYIPADSVIPGATIVAGPERKTYTNEQTKLVAKALAVWALSKIPKIGTHAGLVTWLTGNLDRFVNGIKPTYVESWLYKVYDDDARRYVAYVTIVHHANSSFNRPLKVQHYSPGFYN